MRRLSKALFAAVLAFCAAPAAGQEMVQEDTRPELALMGTIPIYWGEAAGFDAILSGEGEAHWARAVIEREWRLAPLDYLSTEALAEHRFLMLAQPRGFAPEENVALDAWVRGGGKLLLFADPVMTGHSHYGFGDRRRPQDTILLSPILNHWGLDLHFAERGDDEGQQDFGGLALPVETPGYLSLRNEGEADCTLDSGDVVAWCGVGEGHALIVADAALLNLEAPPAGAAPALQCLLGLAMGTTREERGPEQVCSEIAIESQALESESASQPREVGHHH